MNGEPVGKVDVLPLRRGDVVTLRTSGAGGFGDPFERDPAAVLRDVRRGLVTREAAERDYGVVLSGAEVDEAATARRRAGRSREGFGFGPEREAWESVFDIESGDALVRFLFTLPRHERYRHRADIVAAVLAELPPEFPRVRPDAEQRERARAVLASRIGA